MDKKILEMIEYPEKGVLSKEIEKNEKTDISLFSMAKGTSISDHTSNRQGFVYVLEGDGVFTLEGEEISMLSGVFIHMAKDALHSLKANEDTSFMLVLINV